MSRNNQISRDWRKIAYAGYLVIIITFGVGGVWAAVSELDKAVIATSYVSSEYNRKSVQHLEGGLVREILVKEGDRVQEGQVLYRMQDTQAYANTQLIRGQLDSSIAVEARLLAERDGLNQISWPEEFLGNNNSPRLVSIMIDQERQFQERKASLEGQVNVLKARIEQIRTEIKGIDTERDATEKQIGYINQELVGLRSLAASDLIPKSRLYAMERERTRLEGMIGRATADAAKGAGSIGEIDLQIQQITRKFQEETSSALLDARQKLSDLRERITVAQDIQDRLDIRAPRTGTVQNIKVSTLGQVIRPGETLLEIAPEGDELVINAQFSPSDIDVIHVGMPAEIRFPSFHSRTIPLMIGRLETISNDRILDDTTRQYYYLGIISLKQADIPDEYRARVRPGMPAEVIVSAGDRSVLSYLVSPLANSFRKSLREQ